MSFLFNELLYRPLLNALIALYNTVAFHDVGVAIIILTVIIRFVLYPLFYKSFKNQALMQKLQPEIQRIQKDHKESREKQAAAMMALYKTHRVNPFSSFLLILVQLPILIALYQVFLKGLSEATAANLYGFISAPEIINPTFLGLINITVPSIVIVGLAGIAQYVQAKTMAPPRATGSGELSTAERMSRNMVFISPLITVLLLYSLPAAVGLYWLTTSVFSAVQQVIINKHLRVGDSTHGTIANKS